MRNGGTTTPAGSRTRSNCIGERWAMLVLRELAYGPRRFSELKADLPGISANVLDPASDRARSARASFVKSRLPPPASVQVYEATEWGLEAVPVIASLGRWAARSPLHDPTLPMSHVSLHHVAADTDLDRRSRRDFEARIGFRLGEAELRRDGRTMAG